MNREVLTLGELPKEIQEYDRDLIHIEGVLTFVLHFLILTRMVNGY